MAASPIIAASALKLDPAPFAQGSFGEVFCARWNGATRVAVKVCSPKDDAERAAFEGEAAMLARHRHPHVLELYGVAHLPGGPAGRVALVTRLAEGGSLEGLIQRGGHEALVNGHDSGNTGGSAASAAALLLPAGWQALPKYNCAASDLETKDLIDCAAQGRLGAVKDAIARGARANARLAVNGQTALHCASAAAASADAAPAEAGGGPTAVIKYLLGLGGADAVDAKAVDERGNSALHLAARAGVLTRVEALLPRSDLAARDAEGRTVLEALDALVVQGTHAPPEHKRIAELLSRKAPLPPRFIFRALAGAAEGVAFLHSRGVVHNDLKSANILLDAHLEPLVADFGLAKIAHTTLTQTAGGKGPLGTSPWMAPEQFDDENEAYGKPPADVYSLGMIAFELAARAYPWAAKNAAQIMRAVEHGQRPELPADVDPRLAALISDCTKDAPAERPSAAEVAVRARALAEGTEAAAKDVAAAAERAADQVRQRRAEAEVKAEEAARAAAELAAARAKEEEAAARRKETEEHDAHVAAEQAAARVAAEAEAARRAEAARVAEANEAARRLAESEAARLRAERDAAKLRAEIEQHKADAAAAAAAAERAHKEAERAQKEAERAAAEHLAEEARKVAEAEARARAAAEKAAAERAEAARRAEAERRAAAANKDAREAAARADAENFARLPQGERDKAMRAALGPAAARTKGKQLLAACADRDAAAALQLISEGADPDCVDGDGTSPLMFASIYEALDGVAARLVAAGAKLDLVDKGGNSALVWACCNKHAAAALLIVEAGASLNQVDRGGKSALDWASEEGLAAVAAAIRARGGRTAVESVGDADKAMRAALRPAAARAKGEQLVAACARRDAAAALQLISEGADPDCVDGDGTSPLMFASINEELDGVAARLVAAGAKLNLANRWGHSALIYACSGNHAATALLLVEAGAALNQIDGGGKSARDHANERGLAAVAVAIRAHGGRTGAEIRAHM
jgi:ankyrin repeat protein